MQLITHCCLDPTGYKLAASRLLFGQRPVMSTVAISQPLPVRELASALSQLANGFKKFLHVNSNNLSNFNTSPQNVLVLSSATPVLESEVFDGNPANYRNFIDVLIGFYIFNVPVKGCQFMDGNLGYIKTR